MKFGIIVFPGSNCDHDCYHAARHVLNQDAEFIWHKENKLSSFDVIIIPGGFSYGDYLRTGAIAKFSPVMKAVRKFAKDGGLVIGICNGFQILCEAGLLPGVLLKNDCLKFKDEWSLLKVNQNETAFLQNVEKNQVIKLPIAHGEGKYYAESATLNKLADNNQIWLTYENNPNGSG